MLNIAVLVSGGGTNLQALIDAQNRGEIPGGRIVRVIASPSRRGRAGTGEKGGYPRRRGTPPGLRRRGRL